MARHHGANDARMTERTPEERRADHAAIDRLADELLPALVAKLGASGLGELDVREGAWRVRLRMPADGRASRRTGGSSRGGHQPPSPHARPGSRGPSDPFLLPGRVARARPRPADARGGHLPRRGLLPTAPGQGRGRPRARRRSPWRDRRAGSSPGADLAGRRDRGGEPGGARRPGGVRPGGRGDRAAGGAAPRPPAGTAPPPPPARRPADVRARPDRQPRRDRPPDPARLPDHGDRRRPGLQRGRPRLPCRPARRRGDLHRPRRRPAELPLGRRPSSRPPS